MSYDLEMMSLRALNSGGHVHEEIRRKLSTKTTTSAAAPPHHHHHHGHAPPSPPPSPSPSSKQLALEQQTEDASESRQGEKEEEEKGKGLSRWHTILVISNLTGIAFAGSMSTGLLTIGLPRIATDLTLSQNLLLWPASVYALVQGCSLLLVGLIADFAGSRAIYLTGCFLLGIFILASGLAQTGIQLIIFRAFQGVAISLCLPTSVSIITNAFPNGQRRNIGFACIGLGQPLGFSVGLVLGGFFVDSIGWRAGYYLCAGASVFVFGVGVWILPTDPHRPMTSWKSLMYGIDWVGAAIASSSLGMLSFVFAMLTASTSHIRDASNIALLSISMAMIPLFIFWMHRQERLGKPALIPNSLWKNKAFLAICLMVLLSWAVLQSMEWFLSLYFQEIQRLPATQASLRFLPNVILGVILNIVTGLYVHKFRANHLLLITSFISVASPILMALLNPSWPYWYAEFWAVLILPLSADVLFTVSNLLITDVFPVETHALAGAVFNTVAQFGTSIGLAIMAVISSSVTKQKNPSSVNNEISSTREALLGGYRAVFWACLGCLLLTCCIGLLGLRKVGKLGLKKE